MAAPTATVSALSHLAAAALAALDEAEPDPTLDEIADAIQAGSLLGDPARPRVLVIDPDRDTRPAIVAALVEADCAVVAALRTGMAAEYALRQHRPSVVVAELDLRPGGARHGLLLVASLNKAAPRVPVVVVTGPELAGMAERVVRAGARRLLPKGDLAGLVAAVREEHARFVQAASLPGGPASGTPGVGGR
jgi:CheY-like chemotaxis protein